MDRTDQLITSTQLLSLEELVVGLAHELNNPLTSIQGLSRLLAEDPGTEGLAEDLRLVADEADRAAEAVRALREFIGPLYHSQAQQIDAAALLETVVRARRYEIEARGIALEVRSAPDLAMIRADRRGTAHLMLGMLLQSEKGVAGRLAGRSNEGEPPYIRVDLGSSEDSLMLSVTDSGTHVPEDRRAALLDQAQFAAEHGPRDRTRRPAGLGGLAAMAASLGGTLTARHPPVGGLELRALLPWSAD